MMQMLEVHNRLRFHDVRKHPRAQAMLWALLEERRPEHSISHRRMPARVEHNRFVEGYGPQRDPYTYWGLIDVAGDIVGHIYLTARNEIGIQIFERYHRRGYAKASILLLMRLYGSREYLANINPLNLASIELFRSLGFELCQVTMRREAVYADQ